MSEKSHEEVEREGEQGSPTATFDPSCKFVTSPFLPPIVLAPLRGIIALYTLSTAIIQLTHDGITDNEAKGHYSYFTRLTWIGITAYFFASTFHCIGYLKNGSGYPLQQWPRFLQYLYTLLFSTIVTMPILVTIVYWALLANASTFATTFNGWSQFSIHALNTVFALFEIIFSNAEPIPWLHLPVCLVILGGYLGVAYITFATQGFYPYSFLDPKEQGALLAGYIIGIALGECIIFACVWAIFKLKARLIASARS